MKPDGWQDCPPVAKGLVGNIFFAFKTPLNGCEFTTQSVFEHTKSKNWNIGLWIDLTNTKRYYNPKQVETNGVQYVKLAVVGRQSPSKVEVDSFIHCCSKFLAENPEGIIGVHCTHGFNRTGFLICAYLSRVLNLDAHTALAKFAESRPPGIYRQNMVDDFVNNFESCRRLPPPKVATPSWKDGNGKARKEERNWREVSSKGTPVRACNTSSSLRRGSLQRSMARFLKDVSRELKQSILKLASEWTHQKSSAVFRGNEEQQLTPENFERVKSHSYMVSWQPQECFRYLLYIDDKGNPYLINQHNIVSAVPLLNVTDTSSPSGKLFSCLIEGIFVRRAEHRKDNIRERGWNVTFEMNDIYTFKGQSLGSENLYTRLKCLRGLLQRKKLRSNDNRCTPVKNDDPFFLDIQPMWAIADFWKLQRFDWFRSYLVGPNGLVFRPIDGSQSRAPVLKWTAPETKIANFRLFPQAPAAGSVGAASIRLEIHTDDNNQSVGTLEVTSDESLKLSSLLSKVVECELVDECRKHWRFKRESARRIWTDSSDFVQCVWSGTLRDNIATSVLFSTLGTKQPVSRPKPCQSEPADSTSSATSSLEAQLQGADDSNVNKKMKLDKTRTVETTRTMGGIPAFRSPDSNITLKSDSVIQ